MLLYIFSAARDLDERRVSIITILMLLLAVGFHLSSLVLIPSFVYLIWNKYRTKRAMILSLGLSISALVAAVANIFFFAPIRILQIFVPLVANSNNPYYLFSGNHLFDILNGLLLSTPLVVLLWLGISRSDRISNWWNVLLIAPAVAFAVTIDPKIGAFRDWDLLSIAAAPIIAVLTSAFIKKQRGVLALLIPIVLFSLLHTGGWIIWNRDRDAAYQKIKQIVHSDKHYSAEYVQGYNNKAWSIIIGKYYGDYAEVVRAEEERFAGDPTDALNACNLAYGYLDKGDSTRSAEFVRDNWRRYLTDIGPVSAMGSLMFTLRYYHDAERMYETYLTTVSKDYRIIQDLGAVKEKLGEIDTAMALYDQSLKLWKEAPLKNRISFYLKAIELKYYSMAQSGLEEMQSEIPVGLLPQVSQLMNAITSRDYKKADSLSAVIRNKISTGTQL